MGSPHSLPLSVVAVTAIDRSHHRRRLGAETWVSATARSRRLMLSAATDRPARLLPRSHSVLAGRLGSEILKTCHLYIAWYLNQECDTRFENGQPPPRRRATRVPTATYRLTAEGITVPTIPETAQQLSFDDLLATNVTR